MYRILYSDDVEPSESFFDQAKVDGFEIVWEQNWQGAKKRLISEIDRFDAVILDAKGKLNPDSKDQDGRHLKQAQDDIQELMKAGEDICAVIYSGNADVAEMFETETFPLIEKKHGAEVLFKRLKEHIENKPLYLLKKKHEYPFRVFEAGLLSSYYQEDLIKLVKTIDSPIEQDVPKHLYTPIRTLIEGVFDCLIRNGALPREFKTPKSGVNLANCRKLLKGIKVQIPDVGSWSLKKDIVPLRLPVHIDTILEITNPKSHYHTGVGTKYIKYSVGALVYLLLDVLSWLHEVSTKNDLSKRLYLTNNSKPKMPKASRSNNITVEYQGNLEMKSGQAYGFVKDCFVSPEFIRSNRLTSGTKLKVKAASGRSASGKTRMEAIELVKKG